MKLPVTTGARLGLVRALFIYGILLLAWSNSAFAWWNKEWTIRKKITIDTSAKGTDISDPIGGTVVLVRLPEGVFQFAAAKEDGSDLRFVTEDDKTLLNFHLERFDPLMGEAFAWVRLPEVKTGTQTSFWLYYGNTGKAESVGDARATYDADTVLVYPFSERGAPAADLTKNANNAQNAGTPVDGAMIAGGVRLGGPPITIPASPSLAWNEGSAVTISAWVKPVSLSAGAVLFSRQEGASNFAIGLDNGVPFVQVNNDRSGNGNPVAANSWHHLAVVCAGAKISLILDGEEYGTLAASIPALNSPILLGGENGTAFVGEMDELEISKIARSPGFVRFAAYSQGGDKAAKLLSLAQDEQKHSWLSGGGTFAVLIGSLTPDGWVVIGILAVMAVVSWGVMITKTRYLNGVNKGNDEFFKQWHHVATDLTVLDRGDVESARSMGGRVNSAKDYLIKQGSVYRIYHIGVEELQHRFSNPDIPANAPKVLSAQSIEAIRASLDGGLVQEQQRLNNLMVLLTIAISGGPFLGLLGTVIGVMITFAAIAAAGDVNVNAIAPGIAAALLATVAGLAVAIPALFGYNYLITRIKNATSDMHVFIDEFVAKIAEFYRPRNDNYRPRDVGYFDPRANADVGA